MKNIKNKILKSGIVSKEDWNNLSEVHKKLAVIFLYFLEKENNDYSYDENDFKQNFYKMQDKLDILEIDKVKNQEQKEKEFCFCSMKIPKSVVKILEENFIPKFLENGENL